MQNKKLGQNLVVVTDEGSKNLLLQYSEPGKPRAQFCINTDEQRESALEILKKAGVSVSEFI